MKKYWIDFECWEEIAENEGEIRSMVEERLKRENPKINNIEEQEDIREWKSCSVCDAEETENSGVVLIREQDRVICETCLKTETV